MPTIINRLHPPIYFMPLGALLDYAFELKADKNPYLQAGESIVSAEWNVPDVITIPSSTPLGGENPTIAGSKLICWLQGDAVGDYDIVASFTTSAGREDRAWFPLRVFDPETQ